MQYSILSNYTPSYSHYVFYYHKVLSFQFHLVSNWPSQWQVFMVIYLTPLFWSPEQSEVFWRNSACLNRLLYIFYFRLTLNFNLSSPFLKLSHFLSHRRSHLVHLRDYDFGMLGQCKPERQTNPRKQQEMDAEDWTCQPFLGNSGTWRWDWKRSSVVRVSANSKHFQHWKPEWGGDTVQSEPWQRFFQGIAIYSL